MPTRNIEGLQAAGFPGKVDAHVIAGATHLRGSACGVDKADSSLPNIGSLQCADEELIVGLVDGVAALEGQHVLAPRQHGANLGRRGTWEHPLGQLQPLHLTPCCYPTCSDTMFDQEHCL